MKKALYAIIFILGAIVGSHFIKLLENSNFSEDAVIEYITTFKKELNA